MTGAAGSVDAYIAALPPPLAETAAAARSVIDRDLAGASAALMWGHPTWSIGDEPVCWLQTEPPELILGFWHGASITDPSGRLRPHGTIMAQARLRTAGDVDAAVLGDWLRQARSLTLADTV
jgi:hypothetical protein